MKQNFLILIISFLIVSCSDSDSDPINVEKPVTLPKGLSSIEKQ